MNLLVWVFIFYTISVLHVKSETKLYLCTALPFSQKLQHLSMLYFFKLCKFNVNNYVEPVFCVTKSTQTLEG